MLCLSITFKLMQTFIGLCLASVALAHGGGIEFTYHKEGYDWNGLCENGFEQSPIDLRSGPHSTYSDKLSISLKEDYISDNSIHREEHTIGANLVAGAFRKTFPTNESKRFEALQLHMHSPTEHTIDGEHMDVELHIVHQYPNQNFGAVIGILFKTEEGNDQPNPFIEQFKDIFGSEATEVNADVKVQEFLETLNLDDFYSYDGSLTTPPCTEGIKWSILKEVQHISKDQVKLFKSLWSDNKEYAGGMGNNRNVQPLNKDPFWNERTLFRSFDPLVSSKRLGLAQSERQISASLV